MPKSKKLPSLGSKARELGLVLENGVCPLLLAAAHKVWGDMGNTAITLPMASYLHQQVLGIEARPGAISELFVKVHDAAGAELGKTTIYHGPIRHGFLAEAGVTMWSMTCPDVDARVIQIVHPALLYPPPGTSLYDRHEIEESVKDAEKAWDAGTPSREGWVYGDDDKEPAWRAANEDDDEFCKKVTSVMGEMMDDPDIVARFARANTKL